jgi:hypothetical protein
MFTPLHRLSDRAWENLGLGFGVVACATIGFQIVHEIRTPGPSSVSLWFLIGFMLIYAFWCLYGLRFERRAIWLPNAMAAILQAVFTAVVLAKG